MNRKIALAFAMLMLLLPLLAACSGTPAATAQQEPPTPTPLPPDPALDRPTYTVESGPIDRILTVNGRVTPVDLTRLAFHRDGRVNTVKAVRGDTVKQGDLLAELQQDDELDELRSAQDGLVQAQRDLANAQLEQSKKIKQAEMDLQQAQEDLTLVLPGGDNDPIRAAQQALKDAQQEAKDTGDSASEAKTEAEHVILQKGEALQDAQKAREKAFWDNDWAQKYGTNPDNPYTIDPVTGKKIPNKLSDDEIQAYADKLVAADRAIREAERDIELAQRAADQAHEAEIVKNDQATKKIQDAQRELDSMLSGKGNKELVEAQRKVQAAQARAR